MHILFAQLLKLPVLSELDVFIKSKRIQPLQLCIPICLLRIEGMDQNTSKLLNIHQECISKGFNPPN